LELHLREAGENMRGAVMTSDALVASLIVMLIIVAWAHAHSLVVGGAAAEAGLEAKKMRLLAFSDATVRAVEEGKNAPDATTFGMRDVQVGAWQLAENRHADLVSDERICIRRLVSAQEETKILEVCA
jgi:hypothetical protein